MSVGEKRTIAILGGTVAGWMAAATLARRLPSTRYRILVVETGHDGDGLGDFGSTLAALPSIRPFHEALGIDEALLLRATRGSFSLGGAFAGWSRNDAAYFLPFGAVGAPLGPIAFHQLVTRVRQNGRNVRAGDYSIAAIAAGAGRFSRPSLDPRSMLSQYSYGLHLDSWGYRAAMRASAEAHGARAAAAMFRRALLGADGEIASLELDDGVSVTGLLFVDATGSEALLSGATLGVGFRSWQQWLPCDRAMAVRVADALDPPPLGHAEALLSGWRSAAPLAGETGRLLCSQSAFGDCGGASALGVDGGQPPHQIRFENGRREAPWHRNCVAIGAAACVIEPLHPVALHLVQSALARLVMMFPGTAAAPVEAAEYNRVTINEMESARDFQIAQYVTNERIGEPFWDMVRSVRPPDRLAYKLALFESGGRMPMYDDEMFEEADWISLFDGQGLRPRRHDALAGTVSIERVEHHFSRLREAILAAVKTMPSHGAYLNYAHAGSPHGAAA